jgi:hypothetical protein
MRQIAQVLPCGEERGERREERGERREERGERRENETPSCLRVFV